MFSRIVPRNNQVSWRTIPIWDREIGPAHLGHVDPVKCDPARVEFVEPHDQVDQRRLAGAGRPDDCDRLTRFHAQREILDERAILVVSEVDVLELDPAVGIPDHSGPVVVGRSSSASRNSNTRSAEATPDWSRLTIEATCVTGWVNCREYWMKACTSPRLIVPLATRSPPRTAITT